MGVRRAHLVGSIPAASAADAMRLAVSRLGPDLGYLPDGETGVRRNWVIGMIEGFRSHPDLRLVKDGDWSDYDKTPRFALQPGHRLYGAALDLGIAAAARAAMSEFDTLRAGLADETRSRAALPGRHPGRCRPGHVHLRAVRPGASPAAVHRGAGRHHAPDPCAVRRRRAVPARGAGGVGGAGARAVRAAAGAGPACWPAGSRRWPRGRPRGRSSGSTCASAT